MNDLFGEAAAPGIQGLRYEDAFLAASEERQLIDLISSLPLEAARYKQYTARRRVVSYGGNYDYDANVLRPTVPLAQALEPLRARVARWLEIKADALVHALVAEYSPGTPLGWHRDVPNFETIAGVSLGTPATMRFRRYPPTPMTNKDILELNAAPRSIYCMAGDARWGWQHSVKPPQALRWSVTFRTARAG